MDTPKILSLATAVPSHVMTQTDALALGRSLFTDHYPNFSRFEEAYTNAGIKQRHICVPLEWLHETHGWKECNELYVSEALNLLERAAQQCLNEAGLTPNQIDGIVIASSTGLATPSLDVRLAQRMPFRNDIKRLPIFGLGCAGGATGLARTAELAKAAPGSRWLFLVVELCSLTFRAADRNKANIIATALFGDGAAAAIISTTGAGTSIVTSGEYTWPATLDVMGWRIEDDGFGVLFSKDIPTIIRNDLLAPLKIFLTQSTCELSNIDSFIFHPGGAKVLDALDEIIQPKKPGFSHARKVMEKYGNMSAPTVLFVYDEARRHGRLGNALMAALGPGFSASFLRLEDPL